MKSTFIVNVRNFLRYALLSLPLFLFTFCQTNEEVVFIEQEAITKDSKIVSLILQALGSNNSSATVRNDKVKEVRCVEFSYPMTFDLFSVENELSKPYVINNDTELSEFVNTLSDNDRSYISFPVTLIDVDGGTTNIYNLAEFVGTLQLIVDACMCGATDDISDDGEYEFCHKNNKKVYICHKGNTICVSINAIWGHLSNHGVDYLGQCK